MIFGRKDVFHGFVFKEISYILDIEYVTKSVFSWIHFKMDFFTNLIKRTFCSTSRYLAKKRDLERHKIKEMTKERKEKTRESEKRSYKKAKK